MQIAAVILAAGGSTRFGSPIQQARLGDRTMLESVVEIAREAGLNPVLAVVPPALAVPPDVVPVINDAPEEGVSRSLKMGIAALPTDVEAAIILLGDQPTLSVETIRAVLHATSPERLVIAARAGGLLAPPVLLMRDAFGLVEDASGDVGLAPILAAHPEIVTPVEVGVHAPDVDRPADLERLS